MTREKGAPIVEVVARTVAETELADWSADNYTKSAKMEHGGDCTKEPYSCPRCYAEEIQAAAHAAITAFLAAAAEQGWHMRPDEATEQMIYMAEGISDFILPAGFENTRQRRWAEMKSALDEANDAAPEFEWE